MCETKKTWRNTPGSTRVWRPGINKEGSRREGTNAREKLKIKRQKKKVDKQGKRTSVVKVKQKYIPSNLGKNQRSYVPVK